MTWKWFISRPVRQAHHAARHVQKLVHHQRDLLKPEGISAVEADVAAVDAACATGEKAKIGEALAKLEKSVNKWLKPYPHSAIRENIEVLLVAIAVAMGIRTFFLQPFKIPTGSMQPTLFGVTYENLANQPSVKIPSGWDSYVKYWFNGMSFYNLYADGDGPLNWNPPKRFVLFNLWQDYQIGQNRPHRIWFPPDNLFDNIKSPVRGGAYVTNGQNFLRMRVISGDHLFVDRLSYNFRKPTRGDIFVFETHGITTLDPSQQNTYYIKRLVGLGGEHISIGNDRHVVVDGKRLDAATPHFEFVYSFDPKEPPHDSEFSGHVNDFVFQQVRGFMHLPPEAQTNFADYVEEKARSSPPLQFAQIAPYFLTETNQLLVPLHNYLPMGDNTMSSSDGRAWGTFSQEKVIGKSFFVYWPIGGCEYQGKERPSRFGWAQR
jgi:signal peptidase I